MRSWIRVGLLLVVVGAVAAPAAFGVSGSNTITTVAGTGTAGFAGDGGQATSAQLYKPWGVAVDAQGSVYVADYYNHRVRKISGGIITTVAGTGAAGYSGDGGQATSAQLNYPADVAVDAQGNLYISDYYNHRIRKVSGGVITTVAGTGTKGYSGDGGQATSAQLNYPEGIAVNAQGNLYVADTENNRVRKVSNGVITTVAGTGTKGYSGDGGQATSAQLYDPTDVAVDGQGNLYIADGDNYRVRKVSGGIITTVAGTGTKGFSGDGGQATSAGFVYPEDVAVDAAGNLYVSDYEAKARRIRKVSGGVINTIAGTGADASSGDGGPAASAAIYGPAGLALDGQGNLYVTDYNAHRLRVISNKPPTASIDASPSSGQAPLNVSFTGSGSDPDGSIAAYSWNFGDNTTASGASVSHLYGSAGTFHVTLTVTDDSGATASVSRDVTVSAPASPPPPPPPSVKPKPKPAKPRLASSAVSFGKAQAGSEFSVSFTVTNKATGRGVRGSLTCAAKLAGKKLAATRKSTSSSGEAICVWKLPRSSSGDTFVGVISETYRGAKTSRSFSTKVT